MGNLAAFEDRVGVSDLSTQVERDGFAVVPGFAYGTLKEHAESGEERFTVEWNRANDKVCYDILAFSRPRQTLARLGYPLSRFMQKQFAEDSKAAMLQFAVWLVQKAAR